MSKTEFINRVMGLSFKSTQGKYSFCNDNERKVLFSLSESNEQAGNVILNPNWSKKGYAHSIKHIEKVMNDGYDLYIYRVKTKKINGQTRVDSFDENIERRILVEDSKNEGVFLAEPFDSKKNSSQIYNPVDDKTEDDIEQTIRSRKDISDTEKEQLILARRGQGVFRNSLKKIESQCRVTGLSEFDHLVASHIKPWRCSNNEERLDGNNGLLLSPNIDHLFDKGFISFLDDGAILLSPYLTGNALDILMGSSKRIVGEFSKKQKFYLKYHRENVLRKHEDIQLPGSV